MAYRPVPPLLTIDEAENLRFDVLGTCDWGGCDREAWGLRWDRQSERYLTVCAPCSRSTWSAERAPNIAHQTTSRKP